MKSSMTTLAPVNSRRTHPVWTLIFWSLASMAISGQSASNPGLSWTEDRAPFGLKIERLGGASKGAPDSSVRSLSLAAGDVDGDGVPDLIVGLEISGRGAIEIFHGNSRAIYPHQSGRSVESDPNASFSAEPDDRLASPIIPDFLEFGDFNADGRSDLLAAQEGGTALFMFPGDPRGGFGVPLRRDLEGVLTDIVVGDVARRDGLLDVLVTVQSSAGGQLQVFSTPRGAWDARPWGIGLPSESTAMEIGRLNSDGWVDVAVVAGGRLLILDGRNIGRSAQWTPIDLALEIRDLEIGDFSSARGRGEGIVVLDVEGELFLLERQGGARDWRATALRGGGLIDGGGCLERRPLVAVRTGLGPGEDILLPGVGGNAIALLAAEGRRGLEQEGPTRPSASGLGVLGLPSDAPKAAAGVAGPASSPVILEIPGRPTAILPMRLSPDALDDLVVLIEGELRPLVLKTIRQSTVVVNSTTDVADGSTGSIGALLADPGLDGFVSLREAITAANNTVGLDAIHFDIPAESDPGCIVATGVCTIRPDGAELPWISDPVTIDGTTQPTFTGSPVIELDGTTVGTDLTGLAVWAGGTTIRGLVFNRFADNSALLLWTNGGDIVEGCFFGTDPGGAVARGGYNAVHIYGISGTTFGGTAAAARNLVSGGNIGVALNGGATGTTIIGNFFGTDVGGTLPLGNSGNSVLITGASPANTVGGSEAGASNVVAAGVDGATMITIASESIGNLIRKNHIGSDIGGTIDLGGTGTAVLIFEASGNTIGGSEANGNSIAHNESGVYLVGNVASGNLIAGNSIFDHTDLGIDLCGSYVLDQQPDTTIIQCQDPTAVSPNDAGDADSGANDLQNFPVLTSIDHTSGSTTIGGVLNSTSDSTFTIDFYSSSACNPSAFGEGEIWLGSTSVTTDGLGDASFSVPLAVETAFGWFTTATATDAAGSTSEFSRCLVEGIDLEIGMVGTPDSVQSGSTLAYTIGVENFGLWDATGVVVTVVLPVETSFVSSNPACSEIQGTAVCVLGDLTAGGAAQLAIEALVASEAVGPLTATAVAGADQADPIAGNNGAEVVTAVHLFSDSFESGNTLEWDDSTP